MRSIRKIALLVVAAAAVVAVAAPAANAAQVWNSQGSLVPKGTKLSLKNVGPWTFQTQWGVLTCPTVTQAGELVRNDGATVKSVGFGPATTTNCKWGSNPINVVPEMRELNLTSPTSGTMNLKINYEVSPNVKCLYENTAAPVTYTSGSSAFSLSNAGGQVTPPACGPFLINGTMTVADTLGNPLVLK